MTPYTILTNSRHAGCRPSTSKIYHSTCSLESAGIRSTWGTQPCTAAPVENNLQWYLRSLTGRIAIGKLHGHACQVKSQSSVFLRPMLSSLKSLRGLPTKLFSYRFYEAINLRSTTENSANLRKSQSSRKPYLTAGLKWVMLFTMVTCTNVDNHKNCPLGHS